MHGQIIKVMALQNFETGMFMSRPDFNVSIKSAKYASLQSPMPQNPSLLEAHFFFFNIPFPKKSRHFKLYESIESHENGIWKMFRNGYLDPQPLSLKLSGKAGEVGQLCIGERSSWNKCCFSLRPIEEGLWGEEWEERREQLIQEYHQQSVFVISERLMGLERFVFEAPPLFCFHP